MLYLHVEDLTKSFGEKVLFENITFSINKKEKVALIAKNGAGKTSLLNIIFGYDSPDSGKVGLNKDISCTYLKQEPYFDINKTVIEQVFSSSDEVVTAVREYENSMNSGDEKHIQQAVEKMDRLEAWDYEAKMKLILHKLKIFDLNQSVSELSGGQKKRLALANVLINKPDFLILDEPTNHLDFEMIEWLEEYLLKSEVTLFIVTHDRYFLDKVCNKILEMDDNCIFPYKGNYVYFLKKREERINLMYSDIEKAKSFIKKEAEWINRQPQARATKAKSRIDNFYKVKEKATKHIDNSEIGIDVQTTRLGTKIIDIYDVNKKYDNNILIDDFSYKFIRLEKIGIVGNNGVGKSTLLNILTNNLKPDSGEVDVGETVVFGYYNQSGMDLKDEMKVIDVIKNIADVIKAGDGRTMSAAQFLEYFLFPRTMHYSHVSRLSGGEKRRLYLMTVLMKNPNFLILDEPTNDLDIMTLNVLEDYLQNFQGNLLIVSHDRYFTDKLAETLFVFEGVGKIRHFPGNYSAYRDFLSENKTEVKKVKIVKKDLKPKPKNENKLSYKEKFEFEEIEKQLDNLNKEKSELEELLNSGTIPNEELSDKSKRFSELIDIIDEKEMRWLELSEKK